MALTNVICERTYGIPEINLSNDKWVFREKGRIVQFRHPLV